MSTNGSDFGTEMSATEKDGERVYLCSKYAPLNPEGALPRSISARLVNSLYKGKVKRALKDVGVSSGSIPRKTMLRQAVDNPANRDKLFFADRIYSYSRGAPWGKHIYSRLFKPAEVEDGPLTLLDPDKFSDLIEVLVQEQESPVLVVPHSSEWEALALMTIGYSMVQPDDSIKLCKAISGLGPGFRDYLEIDADQQDETPEQVDFEGISIDQPTGEISQVLDPNGRTEKSSPRQIGRKGVSAESLREMHDQLREVRCLRQTSGSLEELDRSAFNKYADAEQAQLQDIKSYEADLSREFDRIVNLASDAADKYFPRGALKKKRSNNALALAEWIDDHIHVSDALSQSCKLLDGALKELHTRDVERLNQRYSAPGVFSIESVLTEIEKYRKEVDAVIFERRASSKSYSDLVLKIADVESPSPSSSLFDLSSDEVVGFLEHIQYDNNLKELAPFLLRHLGELGYWSSGDAAQGYQVINRIVDERATSGDINNLVEVFGCLTPSILQELLTYGDRKIARATILASIYMSFAEGSQTYFNEIWPCHSWEPQSREQALGRATYKFLNHLQTAFGKADGRLEVLKEMLSQAYQSERAAKLDGARISNQSDDLAKRLIYQSPIDNRFYQLRKQASALYFEDLAQAIREERIKDALAEVARVKRALESGELQEAVISAAGNRRQFDANHLSHLRRYVDNRITEVREWCTDFDAVDAQRKNVDYKDKKLRRLIHQLSRHEVTDVAGECSVNWFEYELYKILGRFASASDLDRCWSNFGELASLESLFVSDAASREVVGQSVEWPVWLPPEPKSMSLWGDYVGDHPNWRSLYQDAVATLVLGRDPSPSEVVDNLLSSNLIDSASAACDFSGFKQDSEVGKLRPTVEQSANNQQTITDLLNRCDELENLFTSDHARGQFDKLENRLLATPDYIARKSPQWVGKHLSKIERDLANIVSELSASDDDSKTLGAQLESWLAEAGAGIVAGESIESMERRINQEKKKRSSRRMHLEAIEQLRDQEVPRSLRKKLSEFLDINDRPGRWPAEAQAEETYLYVEQLAEQRQRWWDSLSAIVSLGETRVKLHPLDDCIEQNLLLGIEELLVEKHDRGAEFLALFDHARAVSLEVFYDLMIKEGFCQTQRSQTPDAKLNRPGPTNIGSQMTLTAQNISSLMEDIPNQKNEKRVGIKGAVVAIGKNDYEVAKRIALGVLGDTSSKDHSEVSINLATAIHAWIYSTKGQVLDRDLATKAFGIFFGYWDVLQKTEFRDAANAILMDWLRLANVEGDSAPSLLVNYLSQCRESTNERQILDEVINICGAEKLAINIWKGLAGHEKLTADGRTQLLLLLHNLECEEAIFGLISRFSPSTQSLLKNYLVLVNRASMEQDSDLFLAIHQTLKRLNSRKDTGLRPVKDFASALSRNFKYTQPPIDLTIVDVDRAHSSNTYSVVVRLEPDRGDPPMNLTVSVSDHDESADFRIAKNASRDWIVCESDILLEAREHEFFVEAIDERAAHSIVFDFAGSTVTGNEVNGSVSLEVGGASTSAFLQLSLDELLEIYEGYDGKPVKGRAFVGRLDELEAIRKSVALERAGAIIVYGVRRIGKTSLLRASAEQTCVSFDASRNSIVLTVPVDSFSPKSDSGSFLDRFLLHITRSIAGTKNASLMSYLKKQGASKTSIQKAAQFDDNDSSLPFADRLDIYLRRLCKMADKSVDRAIIAFDEFDKLLEAYVGDLVGNVEQLTNQLRLVATEYDHVGLIIAGSELMRKITDQYRNALYGSTAVIELSCFDAPEQYEDAFRIIQPGLLSGRRDFSLVGKMIVQITGGHPLYMRTLACAAASLTKRNRISPGLVNDAVRKLLKNEVLHGYIPDPGNTVRQPLQALSLMTNRLDEERARLILHVIATRTTLESPFVDWSRIMKSPVLERLGTPTEWRRYRDELRDANLLRHEPKYQWGIRFPILAETMRLDEEVEIERLTAVIEELQEELIE